MRDGSDEPWGIVSLAVAIGFSIRSFSVKETFGVSRIALAALCLLIMGVMGNGVPLLARSVLLMGAISAILARREIRLGHVGLFMLSLPLLSSLQFYGGYPMRWVIGKCAALLIGASGYSVEAVGATLRWRGETIAIDAPCSGIQMLWVAGFFGCSLACFYRLDAWKSIRLLQIAGLSSFAANVVRNWILFYFESGIIASHDWVHDGVGVAVFGLALGVIAWCGARLSNLEERRALPRISLPDSARYSRGAGAGYLALSLLVGTLSIRLEANVTREEIRSIPAPFELVAEGWARMPIDRTSLRYADKFPGRIEIFGLDGRRMVVRVINRATRMYHPARDCYRALGYGVEPMRILKEADGDCWGRSIASLGSTRIEVRERIVSADGQSWTDASSWFWAAALGTSTGPWIAYTESFEIE